MLTTAWPFFFSGRDPTGVRHRNRDPSLGGPRQGPAPVLPDRERQMLCASAGLHCAGELTTTPAREEGLTGETSWSGHRLENIVYELRW